MMRRNWCFNKCWFDSEICVGCVFVLVWNFFISFTERKRMNHLNQMDRMISILLFHSFYNVTLNMYMFGLFEWKCNRGDVLRLVYYESKFVSIDLFTFNNAIHVRMFVCFQFYHTNFKLCEITNQRSSFQKWKSCSMFEKGDRWFVCYWFIIEVFHVVR